MCDASLLFGSRANLCLGVVSQTLFQNREHLVCRFARRADDVDEAELLGILLIKKAKLPPGLFISRACSRLLLLRPTLRLRHLSALAPFLSNFGVTAEGFEPILFFE